MSTTIDINVTPTIQQVTINTVDNITVINVNTQSGGGSQTLDQVLTEGNTSDKSIILDEGAGGFRMAMDFGSTIISITENSSGNLGYLSDVGMVTRNATNTIFGECGMGYMQLKTTATSGIANIKGTNLTSNRNYELPNASGTIALTSDIPTIDATPTDGSSNAVSSNGVFDALATKEPTITAGTTGQYYRGDKTFQTLDKSAVGLGNVDNTSDANKPVSTATQTALNLKQNSLGFTPEDSANKSTSTSDSASSVKFPVWSAILSYFDVTRIKTILGITTLSGNNTGDDATNSQYSGLATSKQDTLVSGTNIKTINSNSILGSGNIVISGSGITAEEAIGYSLIFG
jgi:hypothetical protein